MSETKAQSSMFFQQILLQGLSYKFLAVIFYPRNVERVSHVTCQTAGECLESVPYWSCRADKFHR